VVQEGADKAIAVAEEAVVTKQQEEREVCRLRGCGGRVGVIQVLEKLEQVRAEVLADDVRVAGGLALEGVR